MTLLISVTSIIKAFLLGFLSDLLAYNVILNLLTIIFYLHTGDEVPDSWKGKLNITYRIGNRGFKGNNTAIRIEVNFPNKRQDIYNVIGTIYGKEEPDRWVLLGNHRDAWGFGAVDPSSGTAAMMEISHGLSKLLKRGKKMAHLFLLLLTFPLLESITQQYTYTYLRYFWDLLSSFRSKSKST